MKNPIFGYVLVKRCSDFGGFTLVELLVAMVVIGILSGIIFVKVGSQRDKAKVSSMLQVAEKILPIARDCYFRSGHVDGPVAENKICSVAASEAVWPKLSVEECSYTSFDEKEKTYGINCTDFGKKIICGVDSTNYGCKVADISIE